MNQLKKIEIELIQSNNRYLLKKNSNNIILESKESKLVYITIKDRLREKASTNKEMTKSKFIRRR